MNTTNQSTNNNQTKKATTTMNTTHTFTYPRFQSGKHDEYISHEQYQAVRQFRKDHTVRHQIGSFRCTALDMSRAQVTKFDDMIVGNQYGLPSYDDLTETMTFVTGTIWMVMAPHYGGDVLFVANSLGGSDDIHYNEADAIKGMKKMVKVAFEWNFQESLRVKYADQAKAVCALNASTVATGSEIDPANAIGATVRIHQMGKFRAGIIVGQTNTKWVVVYTTPSNPDAIRTTKVGKDS
jgi:hypothetical protein